MKILVLCQDIYVPNHVRVKLSVKLLNGLLESYCTKQVILKIINSWSYMTLMELNHFVSSVLCDISLSVSWSAYLYFTEWVRPVCSQNFIYHELLCSLPYIKISIPLMTRTLVVVTNKIVYFCYVKICISQISSSCFKIHIYLHKQYVSTCFQILIINDMVLVRYFV